MTNRKIEYWVIPPEADAEFVAHMEEVLATYEKPYNPHVPVLCMDEQPVQLLKETRVPIAATAKHGKRVDYEYERAGTAAIFMFAEPLAGWRACSGREGLNLTGASPVVPIARFRYVAIPQFVVGNHTFSAWCKRPGCPEDLELLR